MKEKYEDMEKKKKDLQENCEEKQVFMSKLPQEIKKISDIMRDFMDIFKINESLHPDQNLVQISYFLIKHHSIILKLIARETTPTSSLQYLL